MKSNKQIAKVFFIAVFTFFGAAQAQVTFKPGLRAGANFSHFTKGDDYGYYYDTDYNYVNDSNFSSKTDFYVGFYGALKLSKYYTLQPEINYSAQGSSTKTKNLDVDYLSFGVINKFTFNNFNIHFGPTLDFVVSKNFNTEADVDMTFVLGAGYQITPNLGIDARVKKGIIPVLDNTTSHTNVIFSVGGTYTFDLK
jgi:hypothetical protein